MHRSILRTHSSSLPKMHSLFPCFFAVLLFSLSSTSSASTQPLADDYCKSLIEQATLPDPAPFDNNDSSVSRSPKTIESEITAAPFAYLMKLCVMASGRLEETKAIPDTGSDLIWLNAKGCKGKACHCSTDMNQAGRGSGGACIKKDPERLIKCEDKECTDKKPNIGVECSPLDLEGGPVHVHKNQGFCKYKKIIYGDESSTEGFLSRGKFKFLLPTVDGNPPGKSSHSEDLVFGLSSTTEGDREPDSKGIVGLGFGDLSFIKQYRLDPKFSYCLPQPTSNSTSKITFGSNVHTSKKATRLLTTHESGDATCEYRYCVHLASISLKPKGDGVPHKIKASDDNKVMVVDSGSTFTYLAKGLFKEFLNQVKQAIGLAHDYKPKEFKPYYNCFEEDIANKLEKLVFEFVDGESRIEIELKMNNFFDRHTPDKGSTWYRCLTVEDGDEGCKHGPHHILGSRAQMDFLVAFDLQGKDHKKVSFEDKQDCSKLNNAEFSALSESE